MPAVRSAIINTAYTPTLTPDREEWLDDAVCATTDPELFFPEQGHPAAPARKICAGCPVAAACLDYSLKHSIDEGVWGGTTHLQRRRIRRDAA